MTQWHSPNSAFLLLVMLFQACSAASSSCSLLRAPRFSLLFCRWSRLNPLQGLSLDWQSGKVHFWSWWTLLFWQCVVSLHGEGSPTQFGCIFFLNCQITILYLLNCSFLSHILLLLSNPRCFGLQRNASEWLLASLQSQLFAVNKTRDIFKWGARGNKNTCNHFQVKQIYIGKAFKLPQPSARPAVSSGSQVQEFSWNVCCNVPRLSLLGVQDAPWGRVRSGSLHHHWFRRQGHAGDTPASKSRIKTPRENYWFTRWRLPSHCWLKKSSLIDWQGFNKGKVARP